MSISWREIDRRAREFVFEWGYASHEASEKQTFWNAFFDIFDIKRRRVALFEREVTKLNGATGFIDVFWPGLLIVEHKSKGKNLERAFYQASSYAQSLDDSELPRYIITSDFAHFRLYDLEDNTDIQFPLGELPEKIKLFGFFVGHGKQVHVAQDAINIKASEAMGRLHDKLKATGYERHDLEKYMVRLLFCLFADDTGIFGRDTFFEYITYFTNKDGSDLDGRLAKLFQVLDTSIGERSPDLPDYLADMPYVDGMLFKDRLPLPSFTADMREELLKSCEMDWGKISPAIFGAMFQYVTDAKKRRELGEHYTSEENILKVIGPLFLDQLYLELDASNNNEIALTSLRTKLASLRFLDPACGCGNFLIVAYREIRKLENIIVEKIIRKQKMIEFVTNNSLLNVDQFFGIEIEEFPAQVARVALWLMDHQMNIALSLITGESCIRLPLEKKANIVIDNALTLDWRSIISPSGLSYILGNPPFSGARIMSVEQKKDMTSVFRDMKGVGNLDYVAAWYKKAADYIQGTSIKVGLVSTNSITQGEQVSILWKPLLDMGICINFAHRTFKWSNEAKNNAAVYCVIIGISMSVSTKLIIFDYATPKSDAVQIIVKRINPYLVDASDVLVGSRSKPICEVPEIRIGNQPIDNGNYLFSKDEMDEFTRLEPASMPWFRPWIGSLELLNGKSRYCLWLAECPPNDLEKLTMCLVRIMNVRKFRQESKRNSTKKLAERPTRFQVETFSDEEYIVIPKVSSENRKYVPIAFMSPKVMCSDLVFVLFSSSLYIFGMLTSTMHRAWLEAIGGKLEGRYRYSKDVVYNNYPWPDSSEDEKNRIANAAQEILNVRGYYPQANLATLYNPNTMPIPLLEAHKVLDSLVEKAYGKKFDTDAKRVAYLIELYRILQKTQMQATNK